MIHQPDAVARLRYMQSCSAISRDTLFLKMFEEDQKLEKDIAALIERRIDVLALMRVAQWQRECGLILVEGAHEQQTQRQPHRSRKQSLRPLS